MSTASHTGRRGFPAVALRSRPALGALSLALLCLTVLAPNAWAQPSVSSLEAPDAGQVVVTFDQAIDTVTGSNVNNYQLFDTDTPATTFEIDEVTVSGADATLVLADFLASGRNYSLRSQNIQAAGGGPGSGLSIDTFDFPTASDATPIADIQANPAGFEGQVVTVEGQVYVSSNYRGATISGYIQDSSGRGINVFGDGADNPILQNTGNVARVTGTVMAFFSTIEITDITSVELVSSGNPVLTPAVLSTGAAASSAWEGTFIQVTGNVVSSAVGGPGTNYTVNDGSGPIVVRVVDTLGASTFTAGQTITARGAGGQFGSDFQVNVGQASDIFLGGGGPDTTPPTVASASAPSATSVTVSFSEGIDSTTGGNAANYNLFPTATPGSPLTVSSVAVSGSNATLTLGASMVDGTGYTVQVTSVEDIAGNVIAGSNSATFTYASVNITPIATIQANPASFEGNTVTVEGQVYVPSNYRGGTISGYIQDGSGRGINLFGSEADLPILQDTGNIVRVTGSVTIFFSTIEIESITSVELISSGNAPLTPAVLSTGAAANSSWEGTFIEVTGNITAAAQGGPGMNYTVNDGSGPIVVRVVDTLGATSFSVGQTITGRGAGGQFGSDFQVNVGQASDVFVGGGGPDTTPPTVTGASASNDTQISVSFSEALDTITAQNTGNYSVFPSSSPANTIAVSSATVNGSTVNLTLSAAMMDETNYTVSVSGVQDVAGNTIAGNNSANFLYSSSGVTPIATIQANPQSFEFQEVTIQGQVFIPWSYRQPDTSIFSGYIQDNSGRGINVFGFSDNPFASNPALDDVTTVVRLTGTVEIFNTTVELVDISSLTVISTGNPPLAPRQLSVSAAANPQWEGTFIEVSGTVEATSVGGPGTNLTLEEDGTLFTVRVVDTLGLTIPNVGTQIWARGAGGQFGDTFQLGVGRAEDLSLSPFPDRSPPSLLRAFLSGTQEVTLRFSEALDPTSAEDTGNYTVTSNSQGTADVTQAFLSGGETVLLTLDRAIDPIDNWTVRVVGVADESGANVIPASSPETANIEAPPGESFLLDGPARTFLPREGERYPISIAVPEFIGTSSEFKGELLLRVFDLQGRLQATLYDSKVRPVALDFSDQNHMVEWNGLNEFAERVPAGAYIVHLRVVEEQSGKTHDLQLPVVVAARLER